MVITPVEVMPPLVPTFTVLLPDTLVTATAAAMFKAPSPDLAPLADRACFACVSFAVPSSVAPPCVATAWVATVRLVSASNSMELPCRLALPDTSVSVLPPITPTANAEPAAVPAEAPADPSAIVMALSVLVDTIDRSPAAVRLDEPPTTTFAEL